MKTNNFRKAMFAMVLLTTLVSFSSAKGKDKLPDFCYNNHGAKVLAESQIVCVPDESGKYLEPRLKYLFTYDENNNVIRKEALRWSAVEKDWVNSYCLTFIYDDDSMITEYAKWNRLENNYDESTERVVYKTNADMYASCSYYKRNLPNNDWVMEHNYLVNVPIDPFWSEGGILIAETDK